MKKNIKNSIFAGECMIEVSGNTDNLDKKQIKMNLNFGGDTFNAAVYFSRLTNKLFNTFYFTGLGKDHLSEMMIKRFKYENLKIDLIQRIKGKYPGLYSIQTDKKGNRSFSYWRNESAAKEMIKKCNLDYIEKFISNTELFYYTGISLGILKPKDQNKLIELSKKSKLTAFDFNYRNSFHGNKIKSQSLFKKSNLFSKINFISFDDIIEIFGKSDPFQFINTFKRKDNIIILKYFEKIFYSEFNKIGSINIPIIKAIDTTAAGDSFNGSFLAYHLINKHLSIEEKILSSHVITKNVLKYRGAIIPKTKMKI